MNVKVLAAAAHPDDIEIMMAGTLLRLKDAGCEIHLWNLANGCCGSAKLSRAEAAASRWREAQASAKLGGGIAHPPLFDDLEIFYDAPSLAKVAAVVRQIQPDTILTQSPQDYMGDHHSHPIARKSRGWPAGIPRDCEGSVRYRVKSFLRLT